MRQLAPGGGVRRAPVILLSRGLCRTQTLPASPALRKRQAQARAAWIQAEAAAPFAGADWAVLRSGEAFIAWYWDAALVKSLLDGRAGYDAGSILPESIAHVADEGWRQVQSEDGAEAQLWRRGGLAASVFQPHGLSGLEWAHFVRAHATARDAPPLTPPAPAPRAFDPGAAGRVERIEPHARWTLVARLAGGLAVVFLIGTVFRAGETAHHAAAGFIETQRIAGLSAQGRSSGEEARVRDALRTLRAAAEASAQSDPLLVTAEASEIAARFGLRLSEWSVEPSRARFGVAEGAPLALRDFAAALEASPRFANVAPQIDDRLKRTYFLVEVTATASSPAAPRTSAHFVAAETDS